MLTFKLSHFLEHPLIQRLAHSITYLCSFQNLRGWMRQSLKTISLCKYFHSFATFSSWYTSQQVNTLVTQTIKVSSIEPLSKVLHSISKVDKVKFKILYKTCSEILRSAITNQNCFVFQTIL